MEDYALLNASQMHRFFNVLTTVEFKMLLMVLFYLSSNNKEVLVNNAAFREFLASVGFSKTPERICTILSALVRKDVLVREGQGVYSVPGNLFLPANACKE